MSEVPRTTGGGADRDGAGPASRMVMVLVAGLVLSASAAAISWDLSQADEEVRIEMPAYDEAAAQAPWLAGMYGTWAEQAEAGGDAAAALYNYGRVLAAMPGHPGTCHARARLLWRTGAVADPKSREQALRDLEDARRGYAYQSRVLAEANRPAAAPAPPPATAELLAAIEDLQRRVRNGEPPPAGGH